MIDVFEFIDSVDVKFNLLREDAYLRKVFTYFSIAMIGVWFLLGYDSGVGLLERAIPNIPSLLNGSMTFQEWVADAYTLYGRTFHFSAFVNYGFLYVALSSHLSKLGIVKSRNVFYSLFIVGLNISAFELIWMGCFAKFQMNRDLLEWLVTDSWFLTQWFAILGMGFLGVFSVWIESFIIENGELLGRSFRMKLRLRDLAWVILTIGLWLFWIYYPLPVDRVSYETWTSSLMFPQTHYAYKSGLLFVENNLLHTLNILVKAIFAYTQLHLIRRFRNV